MADNKSELEELNVKTVLKGKRLKEYLIIKEDLGILLESEMVRWLVHSVFKDHYAKLEEGKE